MLTTRGTLDTQNGPGVAVIVLRGDHGLSTQPCLQAHIDEANSAGLSLVIDLSEAGLIDSAILTTILGAQKRATNGTDGRGHGLAAVASPGARFVARMLSLMHIEDNIAVHHSRDSAVVSLRRTPVYATATE
jgi:hypothetical protein